MGANGDVRAADLSTEVAGPLDRLATRASDAAEDVRTRTGDASDGARALWERLSDRDAAAWRTYGERVEVIAAEADVALAEARAELDVALADTREDLHDAATRLLEEWQGRLDDLKVQAALARMEATDDAGSGLALVDAQVHRVAHRVADVREASAESFDTLRTSIGEAAGLVREGFDEAVAALRRSESLSR